MKHTIHTYLLLSLIQPARAQVVWSGGDATICTGITIRGEMCYQPTANALLFRLADKWRYYTAAELQNFRYVESRTGTQHWFSIYPVGQEGTPFIFEELIPHVYVKLLQLTSYQVVRLAEKHGLPKELRGQWQTPQSWYVWFEGRFMTPYEFVTDGLDDLIVTSPEAVQRWIEERPRPQTLKALARWLHNYNHRVAQAKRKPAEDLPKPAQPIDSQLTWKP